ncbi:hypothetical protein MPTK1_3g20550 [Marchantia polymorpha subsp. ruderalis]|uniref:Disease resistance R13L4/SHOC-2-like LRR domain-containing protein n=2 Tax=Marchantia polymorpha TaxID=3197 RepID=A0AAF6B2Y8_MARPO|nr:hypothetical protein MARPO_0149s0021 [Marchantia polymorpha]BBN06372.1 hypothetical protein Mp_3g20550 [Marchantia polymorpha subsp. ruderalis]|eukprot:PTQ29028.1 hypothetical protein MARPO_0149s0021 [Marchantia polymorpha]
MTSAWFGVQVISVIALASVDLCDGHFSAAQTWTTLQLLHMAKSFASPPVSWKYGTDHCHGWLGVRCSNSSSNSGAVVELNLSSDEFQGQVSDLVCGLRDLRVLNLESPALEGCIPDCVWNLRELRSISTGEYSRLRVRAGDLPASTAAFEITHLQLPGVGLSALPPWISALSKLQVLDLSRNNLVSVPIEIGQLGELKELFLQFNQILMIPFSISNLTKLRTISLFGNNMQAIASSFNDMPHLKTLDLGENQIVTITRSFNDLPSLRSLYFDATNSGQIHAISSSFNHLPTLQSVDLSENDLHVVHYAFNNMSGLKDLYLDRNRLSANADFSSSFRFLPSLQLLNLSDNGLDAVPECVCEFTSLLRLDLSSNEISSIPTCLGRLSSLTHLDFSHNMITDEYIGPSLGDVSRLEVLKLAGNKIKNVPAFVGDFFCLRTLVLSQNMIQDVFVDPVEAPPNLESLDLSGNLLQAIPDGLRFLQRLATLKMSNNRIRDVSNVLDNVTTLQLVDLSFNNLSGWLRDDIKWLSRLESLNLAHNQLKGPIPSSLFDLRTGHLNCTSRNCNQLDLDLSTNFFTDFVPKWLCSDDQPIFTVSLDLSSNNLQGSVKPLLESYCVDYQTVSLSHNNLSGGIPSHGFVNSHLYVLDLSFNQLNGTIPTTLGNISNLSCVKLSSNQLLGSLSGTFLEANISDYFSTSPELKNLIELDLSDNLLSGPIPDNLIVVKNTSRRLDPGYEAPMLMYLNVSHNMLNGCIPDGLHMLSNLVSLDLSHNNLSGDIQHLQSVGLVDVSDNHPTEGAEDCLHDPEGFSKYRSSQQRPRQVWMVGAVVVVFGYVLLVFITWRLYWMSHLYRVSCRIYLWGSRVCGL